MINYIQQLLPRLRGFSSQLDKKELFVDKLFTLLQPNNEVHQYTFNRDGRLFLAINGKTIEGSWELLTTGQLLIKRGKNDKITLDFDFLHPDVLIMKLGGTSENPFIIYRQEKIENGNVLKFLQLLDAKNRGKKVYELPGGIIISEADLNGIIKDENGNIYNGYIYSMPYNYYLYSQKIRNVKKVTNGAISEEFYEVKYPIVNKKFDFLVIWQKALTIIQVGDKVVYWGPNSSKDIELKEILIPVHYFIAKFNSNKEITALKKDNSSLKIFLIFSLLVITIVLYIIIVSKPSQTNTAGNNTFAADTVFVDTAATMPLDTLTTNVDTTDTNKAKLQF